MQNFDLKSVSGRVTALCVASVFGVVVGGSTVYNLQSSLADRVDAFRAGSEALRNQTAAFVAHDEIKSVVYRSLSGVGMHNSAKEIDSKLATHGGDLRSALRASWDAGASSEIEVAIRDAKDELESSIVLAEAVVRSARLGAVDQQKLAEFERQDQRVAAVMSRVDEALHKDVMLNAQSVDALIGKAGNVTLFLTVVGLISVLGFTLYLRMSTLLPLRQLGTNLAHLREGKSDIGLDASEYKAELGEMAEAICSFRDSLVEKDEHEKDAEAARVAVEEERRKKEEMDKYYMEAHEVFMKSFSEALDKLSSGDLSHRITDKYIDEYESIRAGFNTTAEKLEAVLASVAGGAGKISSETERIYSASQHLSKHTEEQASALEETSASMEEMAATVRQNASNAQEASNAAAAARDLADGGRRVADEAVEAMQRIEKSAQRITEMVDVIGEIAFQTNILALNAAVEAARAGDAGKGFAVVANEVRALAQRSATALKSVKEMMADSSSSVQAGSSLSKDVGNSLGEIVESVRKVASLISEIASASQEQASGIDQVGRAVANMESMTQENASLVGDTHAALSTAKTQMGQLTNAVSMFRTSVDSASPVQSHSMEPAARVVKSKSSSAVGNESNQASNESKVGNSAREQQKFLETKLKTVAKQTSNVAVDPEAEGDWMEF